MYVPKPLFYPIHLQSLSSIPWFSFQLWQALSTFTTKSSIPASESCVCLTFSLPAEQYPHNFPSIFILFYHSIDCIDFPFLFESYQGNSLEDTVSLSPTYKFSSLYLWIIIKGWLVRIQLRSVSALSELSINCKMAWVVYRQAWTMLYVILAVS